MYRSDLLRKGRVSLTNRFYSITLVAHKRENIFIFMDINRLIIKEMKKIEAQEAAKTIAFVVMPNHIHWLIQLGNKKALSNVIKSFKGRCSKVARNDLGMCKLWQRNYYDHMIRNENDLLNNARYIIANPLRAKIVDKITSYAYWDCIYIK